jgi:hypothetical protein
MPSALLTSWSRRPSNEEGAATLNQKPQPQTDFLPLRMIQLYANGKRKKKKKKKHRFCF